MMDIEIKTGKTLLYCEKRLCDVDPDSFDLVLQYEEHSGAPGNRVVICGLSRKCLLTLYDVIGRL